MSEEENIKNLFGSSGGNWKNLLEVFPVGILLFDKKFRIKFVNKNFKEFVNSSFSQSDLIGKYLLDDSLFKLRLPLMDFFNIVKGKSFEKKIINQELGNKEYSVVIKGTPVFEEGKIISGSLVVEDFQSVSQEDDEELSSFNTFERFIENLCDCYLVIDTGGSIKYASSPEIPTCEFLRGSDNKKITEVFNNSSEKEIESIIEKVLSTKKNQHLKLQYYSVITKVTLNSVFIPLITDSGEINSIIILLKEYSTENDEGLRIFDNVSELKEFKSIATASSDAIFKTNLHGNIIFWTDSAEQLFGVSESEVKAKFIKKIFPQIDEVYFEKIRNDLLLNKKWEEKLKFVKDENENLINVKVVHLANKNVLIFYCNLIDENQQKIEYAKEEEKKFFKDAVLKSDEMILQLDAYGTISFVNEKFRKKLGYNIDEISGIDFTDLIESKFKIENKISGMPSIVRNPLIEIIPLVAKNGKTVEVCVDFNITHDGETLRYYTVFLHECSKAEKINSIIAETLLEQSDKAVAVLSGEKIIKADNLFSELLGSDIATNITDKNIFEIVKFNKPKELKSILEGERKKTILKIKPDSDKEIEVEVTRIDKSKTGNIAILTFNPTQKPFAALPKDLNYLENLANNLNEFLWSAKIVNNELNIEFVSPGISKVTGYSQMEFISNPKFWISIIHPEDMNYVTENIENFLVNKELNRKEINYRIIKKNGETIWLNTKVKALRDKNGNVLEIFGSSGDITEREKENEKLKAELQKLKEENKTKDKFISIISHDLRSPFTSILGFTQLITTDTTLEKEEIIEYVSNIQEASKNTLNLVNSLLDWTRLQTGRIEITPEVINANYLVKKTVTILSGSAMQKGITLASHVDDSIYITADENILSQVFNNLVSNAIKFTPKGGSIDIYAKKLEDEQKVQFTVKDTGVGIEEKDIPKLFLVDKKFTTLGTDGERGTGLGLSLVKEIINKHNGEILVKSEVGKGTEFIFTIPVSTPAILLVDTFQNERIVYSKILKSITHAIEIYTAQNEDDALDIIKEKMPMLIVTENQLENLNGFEFIKNVKNSGVKYKPAFIVLGKNLTAEIIYEYNKMGVDAFNKPVDLKELKNALDKIIVKG